MANLITLLDLDITAAVSATAGDIFSINNAGDSIALQATFTYGSGGTNATAYIQTTFDDGASWVDIASFQFTTSSATRLYNLVAETPKTTIVTPTDGSLTANTSVDGLIGTKLRTKYVTTGTYAGSTNLTVTAVVR